MQGMLQTFADLRGMLASVRRVRATLSELPPDESMVATLAPLPDAPWVDPTTSQDGAGGAGSNYASHLPDESPVLAAAGSEEALEDGQAGSGRAVEAAQTGDLRLESVFFSYPTRPGAAVLRDLSLTLPRGKVTAIVGRQVAAVVREGSWGSWATQRSADRKSSHTHSRWRGATCAQNLPCMPCPPSAAGLVPASPRWRRCWSGCTLLMQAQSRWAERCGV